MADATVKVFDSAGMPYQHTLTDPSGRYTITDLPEGSYTVAAAKEGYLLSPASGVALSAGSTQDVPLLLTPEPTLSLGAIAGVLSVLQPEREPVFSLFFPCRTHLFSSLPPGPAFLVLGRGTRRACIGLFLPPGEHIALAFSHQNLRLTFTREPFLPPDFFGLY